jgi:hypothetical protein
MTPATVGHADGLLRLEGPADAEAAGDHDGEAAAVEIDQASFPEPVVVPIGPPSAGRALVAARQPVSIWPEFSPITTVASTRGDRVVAESSIPAAIRRKKKGKHGAGKAIAPCDPTAAATLVFLEYARDPEPGDVAGRSQPAAGSDDGAGDDIDDETLTEEFIGLVRAAAAAEHDQLL